MNDILGMISLTTAASVLLILAAVWLIILIIKKQNEYIFRAMFVILVLLLGLIFLRQNEAGKMTWSDIKPRLFPEKKVSYKYTERETRSRGIKETRYVFQAPQPRLALRLDTSGTFFHITDLKPINNVLEYLGLPKVEKPVPELISITKVKRDNNLYKWDDYPGGTLILERMVCQDPGTLEVYQGISNIRVIK